MAAQQTHVPRPTAAGHWLARMALAAMIASTIGVGLACGAADDELPSKGAHASNQEPSGTGASGGPDFGPCTDGATEECHVTIGKNENVLTCLDGERTCAAGVWGPCMGGFSSTVLPDEEEDGAEGEDDGATKPLSLSGATACTNNPCDPACQVYTEVPDGGVAVTPTSDSSYYGGTLANALALTPSGFIDKGLKTPCTGTGDCEFDYHCVANGTSGATCANGAAKCCVA